MDHVADHTVTLARRDGRTEIELSPVFNVAVPFIDRHLAEGRGQQAAIRTHGGEIVRYAELAERVNRCGNALRGLGLAPGARVLLVVEDCPVFFYVFWGAIKAGLVPVPLNTLLRAEDYRFMIEDAGAGAVVVSAAFAGEVEAALAGGDAGGDAGGNDRRYRPAHVLSVEAGVRPGWPDLGALIDQASDALAPAAAAAGDDCFWLYSSGSTGRPKAAVHAHRDMVVTSQRYGVDVLGITERDVCFSAAKLFFAYGLGNAMTFPLWAGGTAVLLAQRPTPELVLEVIARDRPTLFFGVPTLYAAQLRAFEAAGEAMTGAAGEAAADLRASLASLRLCVSAGEGLPAEILRRWQALTGLPILDGIGSTEALHIFITNRPDDIRPGSSGRLVSGYEARIVDEHGRVVAPGASGQLEIRGDSIAGRYWNQAEKTAHTMGSGWLRTGDTYSQDADGYYVYGGRSDDMMKVSGIWCSPFEIEGRLVAHPRVLEAAVVGREDADGLVKPEAWIVLRDPVSGDALAALERALIEHCKQALAPYKYPRWFRFVDALPKTATGKVQRYLLRRRGAPGA
ncbi:MAG TPA: benzoate-CoA ligase family protein [Haliangium sp.]|nr:benzoate-CoA ligase family protein [Haliangium sp.]